jgi:hypothetical protein
VQPLPYTLGQGQRGIHQHAVRRHLYSQGAHEGRAERKGPLRLRGRRDQEEDDRSQPEAIMREEGVVGSGENSPRAAKRMWKLFLVHRQPLTTERVGGRKRQIDGSPVRGAVKAKK